MTLASGSRLGPYVLTGKLGEGGMGEVYRAHDTKLKRDVAIKVLPQGFIEDKERLARFEREAQLLAQLNHPNIAAIYTLEKWGQAPISPRVAPAEDEASELEPVPMFALVMELVEGPTLAERLESGALPLTEALLLSGQIAEALEEAHEKGIVHRDLKPQNIKASREGKVRVLDFGLAKAMDPAGATSGAATASLLAQSPTLTLNATQMGMILGTAAYMSPEQAKGMPVDKRADIWAFGVVLFEMLTGMRLFEGDLVADVLANVLKQEVDFQALPAETPSAMRRLLRRCLERDPKRRLRDIGDARIVLEELISGRGDDARASAVSAPATAAPPFWRRALPWTLAAAATVWGVWATLGKGTRERPLTFVPVSFTVPLPTPDDRAGQLDSVAVSRDGRRLAICDKRAPALLVRELASLETRPVPGTAGARNPFFSPDGAWLGFNADSALKKVALAGGDPVKLCDSPANAPGATWGPGGFVYFTPSWTSGLWRVADEGGQPERVTVPDPEKGESGHYWPSFLPDGRAAVFTIFGAAGIRDSKVALLDLESRRIEVLGGGAGAQYVASGQLVLFRHGVWIALPFDPKTRRITGPETRVFPDLRPLDPLGDSQQNLAFADNGLVAYVAADGFPGGSFTRLAWIDRAGQVEPLPFAGHHYTWRGFDLAPDDRRVAVALNSDGEIQVWLYDLERGTSEQLTRDGQNFLPAWHPDGKRIATASLLRGSFDLRLVRADGGAPPVALLETERDEQEMSWSADGRSSVFVTYSPDTGKDIAKFADGQTGEVRTVVASPFDDDYPRLSPDGRWLSHASQGKLYVMGFPDGGERIQISANGSSSRWSQATPELFYLERGKLVVLRYEVSGDRFRPLDAHVLFEPPGRREDDDAFAVARDGQRFLFLIPEPGRSSEPELRVLTDGFAALRGAADAKP